MYITYIHINYTNKDRTINCSDANFEYGQLKVAVRYARMVR